MCFRFLSRNATRQENVFWCFYLPRSKRACMRFLHPSHIFPDDRRRGRFHPPAPDTSEDELVRNFSAGTGVEQNGGMERKTNARVTLKFFVFGPQMRGGGKKGQRKNRSSQRIASIFKTDEKQKQKGCGECLYDTCFSTAYYARFYFPFSLWIKEGPNFPPQSSSVCSIRDQTIVSLLSE